MRTNAIVPTYTLPINILRTGRHECRQLFHVDVQNSAHYYFLTQTLFQSAFQLFIVKYNGRSPNEAGQLESLDSVIDKG